MPMREQLRNFKKERIMQEAERLFYERGFRGTSLEAIADSMGMTKPFVYGVVEAGILHLRDLRDLRIAALAMGGIMSWIYSWYLPAGRLSAEYIKSLNVLPGLAD